MATRRQVYRSYLLRMWRTADGEERIEIEQNQTAERARLASCAEVRRWIEAQQADALAAEQHESNSGQGREGIAADGTEQQACAPET